MIEVKEVMKFLKEIGDIHDVLSSSEICECLRALYPSKVDSNKLKALGLTLTFAPEGVTTLPGLMVLATSKFADKFLSPLSLRDLKRELIRHLRELNEF